MKATYTDAQGSEIVVAEAPQDQLIYIEGNWYFPPASVHTDHLQPSDTPYTCPWKGVCQYYHVGTPGSTSDSWHHDNAWSYPEPYESAIQRVHKDFTGYIAFWRDVNVTE